MGEVLPMYGGSRAKFVRINRTIITYNFDRVWRTTIGNLSDEEIHINVAVNQSVNTLPMRYGVRSLDTNRLSGTISASLGSLDKLTYLYV